MTERWPSNLPTMGQAEPRTTNLVPERHGDLLSVPGDVLLWVLSGIAFVRTSYGEARAHAYETPDQESLDQEPLHHESTVHAPDPAIAEFLFKLEREDSSHTDDKVKQLLTLSSSLATLVLVFARDVQPRWLIVVLLALLVCTVLLSVSVLAVRTTTVPTPDDVPTNEQKDAWARDLMRAKNDNASRHRFRVDRYRAATRYFRTALVLTPVAALLIVSKPDQVTELRPEITRVEQALLRVSDTIGQLAARVSITPQARVATPATVRRPVHGKSK